MSTTHKFVSLIICDDCRREDNGKEILIGTYAGSMLVNAVPLTLPTFALRIEIIPKQKEYKKTIAILKNPRGEDVFRVEGSVVVPHTDLPASFSFKVSPVIIVMTGEYKIFLGMDEEPEEIASLRVIHGPIPSVPPQVS
jgi:hypothetical protein